MFYFQLRGQLRKEQPSNAVNDSNPVKKKGKQKNNYGTDSSKWNTQVKAGPDAVKALKGLLTENDFEKREGVFEEHRDALTDTFKTCKKSIPNVCKPFFKDHRHLAGHWAFLTNTEPVYANVECNFERTFGKIL